MAGGAPVCVVVPPTACPATLGFCVELVFMLAAPGGRLFEVCGADWPAGSMPVRPN